MEELEEIPCVKKIQPQEKSSYPNYPSYDCHFNATQYS